MNVKADRHPTAIIGENVLLGKSVKIGAYCTIHDNVQSAARC